MKYNPSKHHRRSTRLRGYNYSSSGAYFITANIQNRLRLFGDVNENGMQLSYIGKIAQQCWENIPNHFPRVELDEFIIMPDHMHGIIFILPDNNDRRGIQDANCGGVQDANRRDVEDVDRRGVEDVDRRGVEDVDRRGVHQCESRGVQLNATTGDAPTRKDNYYSKISPHKKSLSVIVRTYKAAVTTLCRENGLHHFQWQRNYYDHIIRSDRELIAIRNYIVTNPVHWLHNKEDSDSI